MSAVRWIPLCLMLIRLPVITGQYVRFTVRIGGEVTLPCGNVTQEQDKCDRTTWSFRRFTSASADLVRFGQVLETANAKSDRLSVTENCSLVVRRVTVDDGGLYTCRQFESGKHEDTHVHLFVIIMTEHQEADKVTLNCSVSAPGWCDQTLKWLYEDAYVDKHNKDMEISGFGCSVTVTFPSSFLKHHRSFICELTDTDSTAKEQFPFSRQSSGKDATKTRSTSPAQPTKTTSAASKSTTEQTTEQTTTTTSSTTAQGARTDCSVVDYIMLVLRVAELVLVTVITVLLIRAPGNQRPVRRSGAAASQVDHDEDEDDGVVKYENCGDTSASVRLR
ncbi:uncharacterized protein LOC119012647 isoform X1 [Acanthopagrus latus]|uniref:uncharacterized protein LOC119012647 isoform X1 n=1 Tax=Acanthopagrus latus TaxID=8177 RepID=UPI00187CF1F2|nr:uncharacterized protein LOC119012647 isoform X1 [Acanthopagrus latus]